MARRDYYTETNKQEEVYSDFIHQFIAHPNNGQLPRKTNVDAVKSALRNLLLTNTYERPGNPEFGSDITGLLFENFSPLTTSTMETKIKSAIERFEPRAIVEEIFVNEVVDKNLIEVTIQFYVNTVSEIQTLDLRLIRDR